MQSSYYFSPFMNGPSIYKWTAYLRMVQSIYKWTGSIYKLSKIHASTITELSNSNTTSYIHLNIISS